MILSENILTITNREEISTHLDGTDFFGVDYDKMKSLLDYGFLYDSRTGDMILCERGYILKEMDSPIMFGLTNISKEVIDSLFETHKDQILEEYEIDHSDLDEMCYEYKINLINSEVGELGLSLIELNMDVSDMIIYLKERQI